MVAPRLLRCALVFPFVVAFVGCGGPNGTDDAGADDAPLSRAPRVEFAEPADGALEVASNVSVRVSFDAPIDPATLTSASFTLVDDRGTAIMGTVAAWSSGGALTPSSPLSIDRTYTATVTPAVTSVDGVPLDAAVSWSFSMRRRDWSVPTLVARNVGYPDVTMDAFGNAIAVWTGDADSTGSPDVYASRFVADDGWAPPERIDGDQESADSATVQVNANGHAVVVWTSTNVGENHVYSSNYSLGGYFDRPFGIDMDPLATARLPRVAIAPNGYMLVAWQQSDGVWAREFKTVVPQPSGTLAGWQSPTPVAPGSISDLQLGAANGSAVLVWRSFDAMRDGYDLFASSLGATGWEEPRAMESDDANAFDPRVAVDANGNVVLVWSQGTDSSLWANRFVVGSCWGTATRIGTGLNFEIGGNANGDVIVITWAAPAYAERIVYRFTVAGGWEPATRIDTALPSTAGDGGPLAIALDDSGDAIAAWGHRGATPMVVVNRFDARSGWGTAMPVRTARFGSEAAELVDLAMDPNGNAVVVWHEVGAPFDGWAATYR